MAHNACVSMPHNSLNQMLWELDGAKEYMQELASETDKGLDSLGIAENPTLYVLVKDGGDTFLEDKAFNYSFCILNVTVEQKKEIFTVWEEDKPGSVLAIFCCCKGRQNSLSAKHRAF